MALNVLLFPSKSVLYIGMAYGVFARARLNANTAVKVRGSLLSATGVPLTCLFVICLHGRICKCAL